MKTLLFLLPFALVALMILLFWRGLYLHPSEIPSPLIGKPVPEFTLPGIDAPSTALQSADLRGHVSVLNVWATWCIPCRDEHPELVNLARRRVVALYGLDYKDDASDASKWLMSQGNPYQLVGYDPKGQVALNLGVYGVPETFVIDTHGIIRRKYIGELSPALVDGELIPLVRELERDGR